MEGAEILSVFQYTVECSLTVADPGKGTGAPGLPLFYDQTEARRAKKLFLETAPSPFLSKGLDDRAPHLSQDLDPAMTHVTKRKRLCCSFFFISVSFYFSFVFFEFETKEKQKLTEIKS